MCVPLLLLQGTNIGWGDRAQKWAVWLSHQSPMSKTIKHLLSSQLYNLTVRNNGLQKPELNKRLFSALTSRLILGWVWGCPHPVLPTPCLEGRADPPAPSQPEFQGHLRSPPSPWLWPILLYIGSYYMKKVPFPTFRDNNSMSPLFVDEVQAS